ncbi:hypothetical protein WN51_02509 [Melipona quadrifasciata]|uniref:Uncharacterized protein n=1 Tax=Melipona quadrifasciata TaxID=166423 RepID=A0A0M8ZVH6_9HYME|nr:hypothetical protein WN51_02509 [Melipona quadrifasciata]
MDTKRSKQNSHVSKRDQVDFLPQIWIGLVVNYTPRFTSVGPGSFVDIKQGVSRDLNDSKNLKNTYAAARVVINWIRLGIHRIEFDSVESVDYAVLKRLSKGKEGTRVNNRRCNHMVDQMVKRLSVPSSIDNVAKTLTNFVRQFRIFKSLENNQFLSSDVRPTSSKEKESDELLYTVWSLVMVRNQLPARVVKMGSNENRGKRKMSSNIEKRQNSEQFFHSGHGGKPTSQLVHRSTYAQAHIGNLLSNRKITATKGIPILKNPNLPLQKIPHTQKSTRVPRMLEQGCSLKFYTAALEGQIEFCSKVFGEVDCSALCSATSCCCLCYNCFMVFVEANIVLKSARGKAENFEINVKDMYRKELRRSTLELLVEITKFTAEKLKHEERREASACFVRAVPWIIHRLHRLIPCLTIMSSQSSELFFKNSMLHPKELIRITSKFEWITRKNWKCLLNSTGTIEISLNHQEANRGQLDSMRAIERVGRTAALSNKRRIVKQVKKTTLLMGTPNAIRPRTIQFLGTIPGPSHSDAGIYHWRPDREVFIRADVLPGYESVIEPQAQKL